MRKENQKDGQADYEASDTPTHPTSWIEKDARVAHTSNKPGVLFGERRLQVRKYLLLTFREWHGTSLHPSSPNRSGAQPRKPPHPVTKFLPPPDEVLRPR
jgi:hypothetical protein